MGRIFEIFQICAQLISRSTLQNHFIFLSEVAENMFCGTQQTAHELRGFQNRDIRISIEKLPLSVPRTGIFDILGVCQM